MPNIKQTAIVIKKKPYREADLILTLLSKDSGRISAISKSAKKPKSRFGSNYELLSLLELEIYAGQNLGIIREVKSIYSIPDNIRSRHFYFIHYFSELLYNITREDDQQKEVYDLSVLFMNILSNKNYSDIYYFIVFTGAFIFTLGYGIDLQHYKLDKEVDINKIKNLGFNIETNTSDADSLLVSNTELKILNLIYKKEFDILFNLKMPDTKVLNCLKTIIKNSLVYDLNIHCKSLDFLNI